LKYAIVYAVMICISFILATTHLAIKYPTMDDGNRIASSAMASLVWPLTILGILLIAISEMLVDYIRSRN